MRKGAGAGERFLHDDAGGQRIFPFDVGPDDAGDIEGVLDEMHIAVARARQLAMQRMRRAAREQHHRQPVAKQVLDRHAGVRGAGIDMHQHGLAAPGRQRIATRHMHRDHFMRAQDHLGMLSALLVPACHFLDQRHMVGAEIGEDVIDAEIDQAFEEIMRGRVSGHA